MRNISNYSFRAGLIASNLMRITILSKILAFPTSILYFIGYSTWWMSSLLSGKDLPRKKDSWYGFAQIKEQHQLAAFFGTVATLLCLALPELVVPIAWLFLISNLFWSIGEHHLKYMPDTTDPTYSSARQRIYCYSTLSITALSFITALSTTALFYFPLIAPVILPVTACFGAALTLITAGLMIRYLTGNYVPDMAQHRTAASTHIIASDLGIRRNPHRHVTFNFDSPLAPPKTREPNEAYRSCLKMPVPV